MTNPSIPMARSSLNERVPLRLRLAQRGIDGVTLLVVPAALFILLLFVYPFLYGLLLSVRPKAETAGPFANYARFFSDPFLYDTILTTLKLALPVTLGAVLVAEGLLNYLGPQGWLNRLLMTIGLISSPIRLVHNYWGVFIALIIHSFPFTFLLTLSYVTGIDPSLEHAASTLGAGPRARFRYILLPLLLPGLAITFCLSFVQDFAVFPSAVLLGAPAGPTRVISLAAYQAAFEEYDYSMASAVAMIMGFVQLVIVVAVLTSRGLFYRGPAGGAKG